MNRSRSKNLMPLWLFALLLNAFSFASLAAVVPNAPAEMVYCPLTKRLQPVKAPVKKIRRNPLDDICADKAAKNSFLNEIFKSGNLPAVNRLTKRDFENLVFDFSRIGKAAFQNLPPPTDFPRPSAVKKSFIVAGFSKNDELKFVWKTTAANFSFAENPRPPMTVSAIFFGSRKLRKSEKLSRRIAPRAPPFSL